MRALIFILAVFVLVGGAALAVALLTEGRENARRKYANTRGLWTMQETTDEEQVMVYCIEPYTERRLLVGAAPFAAADFDMQLELLRSEGRQRLVTLNAERKKLKS